MGVPDARILAPGDPERSTLLLRMVTADERWRMPSLATSVPDLEAINAIRKWIGDLDACSGEGI